MSLWRQLIRGLRVLVRRRTADEDVADEVQHWLEQATTAGMAGGLAADEARRAARLELGNVTLVREEIRAYGWENVITTAVTDLRYAGRRLRGSPGFTTVCVLTLALGIGATTAIFSAVNPVLFEPLPYRDADRIMTLWDRGLDGSRVEVTFGTHRELSARSRTFDALAVMRAWRPTMTGATEPERFDGQRVTAGYFRVLGVAPAIGRDFDESEDRVNGPRVVILSDALWRRRFGSDSAIVGRRVILNDDVHTVIGVMPRAFENVPAPSAELWAPLQYDASLPRDGREWGHHLRMVGRLRAGVGVDGANREVSLIARAPVAEFARVPWAMLQNGLLVESLQDDVTRGVRPALLAVLGAMLLVLSIACVNVTNLLLARGGHRHGEFALRAALGAGRGRLVRQLLTESLLLAFVGGALGVIVAEVGVRALVALSPPGLPRLDAIRLDAGAFAFGMALTTLIGVAIGVVPAFHASRSDPHSGLQRSSARTIGGPRGTRRALVVAEVSLALVLLVGAGLLVRSLQRLLAVRPGFDSSGLLTMQVQAAGRRFADDSATLRFFEEALAAVRGVPGVTVAALTSQLPLSGDYEAYGVRFESVPVGAPDSNADNDQDVIIYAVSPAYFQAMGIPLRRGRLLDERDAVDGPVAVVINESFARRRLPGRDPIGQRIHVGSATEPWYTVVGVVGDVRQASLAVSPEAAVYVPAARWYVVPRAMWLVVRARGDAAALAPAIRSAIWSVDKDQPIVRLAMMDELVEASAAERRFASILFQAFALMALLLAATGIYGVLSGGVTERLREIGVRSALGASRGDIVTMVLRQGMVLTALGVVIGLGAAVAASQALVALLFGVTRLDPVTYLAVVVGLFGVSAVACWMPAWRAARVDPTITLRAE